MKRLNIKTSIPKDHKLLINIPDDLPVGPADIVIIIKPEINKSVKRGKTAGDILHSPLFGIWKDRKDIGDSMDFAKNLRKVAETRKHE